MSLPPEVNPASKPHPDHVRSARDAFWQNVVIEMLTSLTAQSYARATAGPDAPPPEGLFTLITHSSQKIPVAGIAPLLACSISDQRSLSAEVQCSVFRVYTPAGEVVTLPVSEIASVHAISREAQERLQKARAGMLPGPEGDDDEPFGFAAFTSLARSSRDEEERA
ncbi:MAG: hypothetical protein AAGB51_03635 [Planctomycetota bacterium]